MLTSRIMCVETEQELLPQLLSGIFGFQIFGVWSLDSLSFPL